MSQAKISFAALLEKRQALLRLQYESSTAERTRVNRAERVNALFQSMKDRSEKMQQLDFLMLQLKNLEKSDKSEEEAVAAEEKQQEEKILELTDKMADYNSRRKQFSSCFEGLPSATAKDFKELFKREISVMSNCLDQKEAIELEAQALRDAAKETLAANASGLDESGASAVTGPDSPSSTSRNRDPDATGDPLKTGVGRLLHFVADDPATNSVILSFAYPAPLFEGHPRLTLTVTSGEEAGSYRMKILNQSLFKTAGVAAALSGPSVPAAVFSLYRLWSRQLLLVVDVLEANKKRKVLFDPKTDEQLISNFRTKSEKYVVVTLNINRDVYPGVGAVQLAKLRRGNRNEKISADLQKETKNLKSILDWMSYLEEKFY